MSRLPHAGNVAAISYLNSCKTSQGFNKKMTGIFLRAGCASAARCLSFSPHLLFSFLELFIRIQVNQIQKPLSTLQDISLRQTPVVSDASNKYSYLWCQFRPVQVYAATFDQLPSAEPSSNTGPIPEIVVPLSSCTQRNMDKLVEKGQSCPLTTLICDASLLDTAGNMFV